MIIEELYTIIEDRKKNRPSNSYISSLFKEGKDRIIQKFGEEAVETIIASKGRDKKRIVEEVADVWFHVLVLMAALEIAPKDVLSELSERRGIRRIRGISGNRNDKEK